MRYIRLNNMQKIENLIKEALTNLGIEEIDFSVEHPADLKMGDYSTNVSLVAFKGRRAFEKAIDGNSQTIWVKHGVSKTNPKELADKIVAFLSRSNLDNGIEKIEVAGPGFINFYLAKDFFQNSVKEILENKDFGRNKSLQGQKIMVEHTDPNPFKEFHIGHLMPNVIGSTIARVLAWNGGEVKEACYQGDVGMHVAKAIWAMLHGLDIKVAYATGSKVFEENEEAKKEIQEINKKIYDKSDEKINALYESGRKESLEYFDSVYKTLGTHFDFFFFESEVAGFGKEIVEKNLGESLPAGRQVFEKGDKGAIIFKAENFDKSLHTRVFINSEGLPTYEAKELGLAKEKYDRYKYDKSIVITGNEINDYFKVLLCAMKQIFPELAEKTLHFSHGMLRLPTGKMSSRSGDVITAENLIEMLKEKVKGDERVAIGAIKYMILRQAIGGNIIFDLEKSVSTEGDSGVYLQYSYARANSILKKAKESKIMSTCEVDNIWQTTELEKLLYKFPEVVLRAGQEFAPHYIVSYLTELARAYNSFYGNNQIIGEKDPASPYKVALSEAFSIAMRNGLNVLGIPVLEKM